ncbi:MAG: DUF3604 domain-containing protein [Promethearchaeota archaeon]
MYHLKNINITPKKVRAREFVDIKLLFSLDFDILYNSFLIFRFRGGRNNKNDWYFLQNHDPHEKGFFILKISNNPKVIPLVITGKDLLIKYLILEKAGIKKNTPIILHVSNTLVQSFVEKKKKIEVLIQFPNKLLLLLRPTPNLQVINNIFDHIRIISPSTVNLNESFKISVRLEDKYNNLVEDYSLSLKIFLIKGENNKKLMITLHENDFTNGFCNNIELKINEEGIYHFEGEIEGKIFNSNPITCKNPTNKRKLFWGFIHGHTNKSDGIIAPEDYFENLIKAGLNFGTCTEHDHSWETNDEDFEDIKQIIKRYNQDEKFITFFGYEYGTWFTGFGDICIYYKDDSIPIFRSEVNKYNSIPKLIKNLRPWKDKVLMICHHSALRPGYRNWDFLDNELEKLVEIYSAWGNQEYPFNEGNPIPPRYKFFGHGPYAREKGVILEKKGSFVRDALQRGYKLGFTAGGDDHLGIFPSGPIEIENGLYKPGIMGLWAKELTRESLWEALHRRHCYGTTGPRVIIEFYLEQFFMGDIIDLEDQPSFFNKRNLIFNLISPILIEKIEIIRNNKIFKKIEINSKKVKEKIMDLANFNDISLTHTHEKEKFVFYYLRIFLESNNMAWSSPIWIVSNKKND